MNAQRIPASGSRVAQLQVGTVYGLENTPGTYLLVQFDSSDDAMVRELGSGTLLQVKVRTLKPLHASENTRQQDLATTSKEHRDELEAKLKLIQPFLAKRRVSKAALQKQAEESGYAVKTLRSWIRRYRRDPRLSSLGRKKRSDIGESRFDKDIETLISGAVKRLLTDGNLSLDTAHKDLVEEVAALAAKKKWEDWKTPSYGTLYGRYRAVTARERTKAKLGERQAELLHGISRGSFTLGDHPFACVQCDHLELPVMIVDEEERIPIGKAWITVLIDVYSRCVAGYYLTLEAPSTLSLGLALSHMILPKTATLKLLGVDAEWPISGFPWRVHADNAGEFHGNMLELAAKEYCFDILFRKVRHPNYGGHIESYLGTLSGKLRELPGSTREGPETLGDTDPAATACMTLKEIEKYIIALILEYHSTPHSGLGKMTPLQRFKDGLRGAPGVLPVGSLRQALDPERLRVDFLPCDSRVVHPEGIVWDKIWYLVDELQPWINAADPKNISGKQKFLVRRDPRDLSQIYFLEPDSSNYLVVGTKNLTRPHISLWELRATNDWLKARGAQNIDEDMLFAANAERKKLRSNSIAMTKAKQAERARQKQRENDWKESYARNQAEKDSTGADQPPATAAVDGQSQVLPPVHKQDALLGTAYDGAW